VRGSPKPDDHGEKRSNTSEAKSEISRNLGVEKKQSNKVGGEKKNKGTNQWESGKQDAKEEQKEKKKKKKKTTPQHTHTPHTKRGRLTLGRLGLKRRGT